MAPSLKQQKRFWIANKCRCCKQTIFFSMKTCLSITSTTVWMNHWQQNVSTCHYTSNWPDLHGKISQNPTQQPWKLSRTRRQRCYPQTAQQYSPPPKKKQKTLMFILSRRTTCYLYRQLQEKCILHLSHKPTMTNWYPSLIGFGWYISGFNPVPVKVK